MSKARIPADDYEWLHWMQGFASHVAMAPADYELTVEDALALNDAVARFQEAMAEAYSPRRSAETIRLKNDTRMEAVKLCRQYAAAIERYDRISGEENLKASIRPPS